MAPKKRKSTVKRANTAPQPTGDAANGAGSGSKETKDTNEPKPRQPLQLALRSMIPRRSSSEKPVDEPNHNAPNDKYREVTGNGNDIDPLPKASNHTHDEVDASIIPAPNAEPSSPRHLRRPHSDGTFRDLQGNATHHGSMLNQERNKLFANAVADDGVARGSQTIGSIDRNLSLESSSKPRSHITTQFIELTEGDGRTQDSPQASRPPSSKSYTNPALSPIIQSPTSDGGDLADNNDPASPFRKSRSDSLPPVSPPIFPRGSLKGNTVRTPRSRKVSWDGTIQEMPHYDSKGKARAPIDDGSFGTPLARTRSIEETKAIHARRSADFAVAQRKGSQAGRDRGNVIKKNDPETEERTSPIMTKADNLAIVKRSTAEMAESSSIVNPFIDSFDELIATEFQQLEAYTGPSEERRRAAQNLITKLRTAVTMLETIDVDSAGLGEPRESLDADHPLAQMSQHSFHLALQRETAKLKTKIEKVKVLAKDPSVRGGVEDEVQSPSKTLRVREKDTPKVSFVIPQSRRRSAAVFKADQEPQRTDRCSPTESEIGTEPESDTLFGSDSGSEVDTVIQSVDIRPPWHFSLKGWDFEEDLTSFTHSTRPKKEILLAAKSYIADLKLAVDELQAVLDDPDPEKMVAAYKSKIFHRPIGTTSPNVHRFAIVHLMGYMAEQISKVEAIAGSPMLQDEVDDDSDSPAASVTNTEHSFHTTTSELAIDESISLAEPSSSIERNAEQASESMLLLPDILLNHDNIDEESKDFKGLLISDRPMQEIHLAAQDYIVQWRGQMEYLEATANEPAQLEALFESIGFAQPLLSPARGTLGAAIQSSIAKLESAVQTVEDELVIITPLSKVNSIPRTGGLLKGRPKSKSFVGRILTGLDPFATFKVDDLSPEKEAPEPPRTARVFRKPLRPKIYPQPSAKTTYLYDDPVNQGYELAVEILLQHAYMLWRLHNWEKMFNKVAIAGLYADKLAYEPLAARCLFYLGVAEYEVHKNAEDLINLFVKARRCKGYYAEGEIVEVWLEKAEIRLANERRGGQAAAMVGAFMQMQEGPFPDFRMPEGPPQTLPLRPQFGALLQLA